MERDYLRFGLIGRLAPVEEEKEEEEKNVGFLKDTKSVESNITLKFSL